MSKPKAPNCPNCGATMLPTFFGMPMGPDDSVYMMGCLMDEKMPDFGCKACKCLLYADGSIEFEESFE